MAIKEEEGAYMRKAFLVLSAIGIISLTLISFSVLTVEKSNSIPNPVAVETYTAGDFDQLQIHKIYRLSPSDSPSSIPVEDFEENGRTYRFLEMKEEKDAGGMVYTVVLGCTETPYHSPEKS